MPDTLPTDDPNLIKALRRMRRVLLAWAALFAALAVLSILIQRSSLPIAALHWLLGTLLLAISPQPAYLGLVAVLWGISLLGLIPAVNQVFILDPVAQIFGLETIESLALAFVRLALMVMAWNQFMFYRMLYGTKGTTGLDFNLPAIPEMVANHTDRLAQLSWASSGLGLVLTLIAFPLSGEGLAQLPLMIAFTSSAYGIGLGIGSAFSPTNRRNAALVGVGLGVIGLTLVLSAAQTMLI